MEKKKKDRSEYMREYKKHLKRTGIDLTVTEREKLDKIVKNKNTTIIAWVRNHIEEDYRNL